MNLKDHHTKQQLQTLYSTEKNARLARRMHAIYLAAGGLSEYAAGNRARLVRGEGAAREETRIRLGDVLQGRTDAANIELRDGDIIVVPESFF